LESSRAELRGGWFNPIRRLLWFGEIHSLIHARAEEIATLFCEYTTRFILV